MQHPPPPPLYTPHDRPLCVRAVSRGHYPHSGPPSCTTVSHCCSPPGICAEMFVDWLPNIPAPCRLSLGCICFNSCTCCHTERSCRSNLQFSYSILTPYQPVPALTQKCHRLGREATRVSVFQSLVWLDWGKQDLTPGSAPNTDALPQTSDVVLLYDQVRA